MNQLKLLFALGVVLAALMLTRNTVWDAIPVLIAAGLAAGEIYIQHQANKRLADAAMQKLGFPAEYPGVQPMTDKELNEFLGRDSDRLSDKEVL